MLHLSGTSVKYKFQEAKILQVVAEYSPWFLSILSLNEQEREDIELV